MTNLYLIYWCGPGAAPWTEWLTADEAAVRAAELDAQYPECAPHGIVRL